MHIHRTNCVGWTNWWVLLCLLSFVTAVKDHTFKTCDQAGFCHRNRHFASQVRQNANYIPQYHIEGSSVGLGTDPGKFSVIGTILKKLPNDATVELPFEISVLDNTVRVTVDENRKGINVPNVYSTKRYSETSKWAFLADLPYQKDVKNTIEKNRVSLEYGQDLSVQIDFYPVKITVLKKGEPVVVVNDQNLLNVEHWRSRSDDSENHLSPEESDYDMFEDSFHSSKEDSLPFGPEAVGLDFAFKGFTHLYGIPEHADSLDLKDTTGSLPYRLFNVDIFEYETDSRMSMYGTIPFLMAVKPDTTAALFWINSADTFIDIDKNSNIEDSSSHWISENGLLDFLIIVGDTPAQVNEKYGSITGNTQLPPMFSLGYHQCRWNYNDETDVLDINAKFDEHQIPYDTIWLDIEYADQKKYFTWQNEKFPDPKRMLSELDHTGRNLVFIVDPHIKTGYSVSKDLISKKITINDKTNSSYHGHCWPGESVWVDSMNPNSQSYWDSKFEWSPKNHFMGGESDNIHLWNDMNEPSVFNGPEDSSPRDNIHYGGWEHRSVHNVYGLTFHEATYNALAKRQIGNTNRERPFVLTRAYYAGSQRTAAMWTGDNMSKWEYLKISIPMVLTSGVSGMPFAGADVGGFFGNPSKELLTRWYQTGIWYPFFRAHAHIDSRRREPWVAGEPYTSIMRDAIKLRYSLLPVIYTSFYESSTIGTPVMRPIFYDHLDNLDSYSIDDQFYIGGSAVEGSGILVKPVTDEGATEVSIYIPNDEVHYDYTNGQLDEVKIYRAKAAHYITKAVSLNDIPMLLTGGSILALKNRYRRSTKLMKNDPYSLVIALDSQGKASGSLYIDDGESFLYSNDEYANVAFTSTSNLISGTSVLASAKYLDSLSGLEIEKITLLIEVSGHKAVIHKPQLKINTKWEIRISDDREIEHDEL
ncbi:glycoside hydrolase family 31 protein [Suhomyces tanzawaensis NRRL Y-17324]|uniref:Glucosidase II subunit alpha n=1 Tax=Suhomyces tanzawaensis NRRL Y-17324 TaxID=984487 RepID=A0A1E4SPY9_9ASCO|nr:glycoside hydrolase family 31 protein [Suhomyces tanzawaensis NRRL Y-17324]ODV81565.1 glycoside hydrolase family 31 protein [Suhomyces tanzawaensis NRRL Y-17324]